MPPAASFFIRKYLPKKEPTSLFASGMDDIHRVRRWSAAPADEFPRGRERSVRGRHGSRMSACKKAALQRCICASQRRNVTVRQSEAAACERVDESANASVT